MSVSRDLGAPGRVADAVVAGLADLDPRAAQALGRPGDQLWADPGPAAVQARADLTRSALAELRGTAAQEGPAEVLRRTLAERLASDLALHDSGFTPGLVAPLASPAHAVLSGLESAVREPDRLLQGLADVPAALGAYAERLEAAAADGYAVPTRQSRALADQLLRWADPAADDRLGRLLTRAGTPEGSAPHTLLQRAREACTDLAAWLVTVHAPRGREREAVGADLYRTTASAFLGTPVDLDETYAYGWERLAELTAQAEDLAAAFGFAGVAEAEARLDAGPEGLVPVGPELVAWVEERIGRATSSLDGIVDVPTDSPVEAVLAAPGSGSIYYSPPDPAGTRPGRVVWSTPTGAERVPVWREVSTVLHEGVPGHHLQHAVAAATTTTLHPWQRHLCHVHGHAEGWAHYVEGRAALWGLLEDPAEQLGTVLAQRWRAARIVVDMGLHLDLPVPANAFTDATRWEPGVGVEVLTRAAGCDEETARFEIVRYLGWPGQALAFALGARLWEDAREAALAAGHLDERTFHARALALGPMGMAPLRATLEEAARA